MNTLSLESALGDPNLRARWANKLVYIFSKEHGAYWRAKGQGYTTNRINEAGIFDFSDAFSLTCHCGPEKMIEFEEIKT